MNDITENKRSTSYLLILVPCIVFFVLYFSYCTGISKKETRAYISDIITVYEESEARAETAWTNLGSFSEMNKGFNSVLIHPHHKRVDPVVVAKFHHWAECGKDLIDEKDGEIASFFKGGLVGAALALDFGGITYGGSSLGAYGVLEADASDEERAAERFADSANDLHQYILQMEY